MNLVQRIGVGCLPVLLAPGFVEVVQGFEPDTVTSFFSLNHAKPWLIKSGTAPNVFVTIAEYSEVGILSGKVFVVWR